MAETRDGAPDGAAEFKRPLNPDTQENVPTMKLDVDHGQEDIPTEQMEAIDDLLKDAKSEAGNSSSSANSGNDMAAGWKGIGKESASLASVVMGDPEGEVRGDDFLRWSGKKVANGIGKLFDLFASPFKKAQEWGTKNFKFWTSGKEEDKIFPNPDKVKGSGSGGAAKKKK